nr:hypothetical protein [Kibdelosporangium sp. MJ126-NF4]CEL15632.1 hypothetical protein [Kibdelosporangium sp. MJ126-NF4]CTQ90329.1 hypothetical protein [Kibdelosporangium sp. MJ126-NF4]
MNDRYVVVDDLLDRIIDEQETRLAEERSGVDAVGNAWQQGPNGA